jgi:hypothetical protein
LFWMLVRMVVLTTHALLSCHTQHPGEIHVLLTGQQGGEVMGAGAGDVGVVVVEGAGVDRFTSLVRDGAVHTCPLTLPHSTPCRAVVTRVEVPVYCRRCCMQLCIVS